MTSVDAASDLPTLATAPATRAQQAAAAVVCLIFAAATFALLPVASQPVPPMPGFVPVYQSALIAVYAVTAYLLLAQARQTGASSLLVLGAGSLFTTVVVTTQLLSFPNLFGPGPVLGQGPDTTVWLWTLWHLGPTLFALPYAFLESAGRPAVRLAPERMARLSRAVVLGAFAAALIVCFVVARHVEWLPKSVSGDDYRLLTTSGIGPAVVALNALALAVLCWRTRLRTLLQLWLAVSLFLLLLDNVVTLPAGARGTVGWLGGRVEALIAGIVLLGVYLREVDLLYGAAGRIAAERGRQRTALQHARDHLDVALDAAGMGDWEIDLASDASRRTARHDRIFGYDALQPRWGLAELRAHILPEDRPAFEAALATALAEGRLEIECRIRRADDGATRWVDIRGRAYGEPGAPPTRIAGVVSDTTDHRQAQERLSQAQKMEAIGQLTGGVAHDFNNLLTVIVGSLDMISRRPSDARLVERLSTSAMVAARRGAEVTEKLLSFSRRQVLRPETVNPNRLLTDFRPLLERAVGETIRVEFALDPVLDPVRLDPGQFESAVLNLAVNARDAMPSGGTLRITTENAMVPGEGGSSPAPLSAGRYVVVCVGDSGVGMDPQTAAQAFEPFFTTKDVGKGTGLGLSQVYGFATQAGGHAAIESAPGRGTTIRIHLPRSAERAAERPPEGPMLLRQASDGEVVLVVEDEPAVLDMAIESLAELGYRTLAATHAQEALDRLKGPERIDILFSDVVMPGGMNGMQLAVAARRLRPGLRVLLTSGYTGSPLSGGDLPADQPLLSKPYLREDLADKLRVVMGRG